MTDGISLHTLSQALVELNDARVAELTQGLLKCDVEPVEILTTCEQALTSIGEKYAAGEYFISGLIMAGEIMSSVTEMVTPHLVSPDVRTLQGRILIGTIEGDIHDLGKNIAGALLSAYGFSVRDLGVDVPVEDFIKECREFQPDIIGLSALLSACYPSLQKTINGLKEMRQKGEKPAIFISGAQITAEHRQQFGADYHANTAFDTVHLCQKIIKEATGESA